MPQIELPFDTLHLRFETNTKNNRSKRLVIVETTLYEAYDFALAYIVYEGVRRQGLAAEQREKLREAWNHRHTRPFGDAYWTEAGSVYYLVD